MKALVYTPRPTEDPGFDREHPTDRPLKHCRASAYDPLDPKVPSGTAAAPVAPPSKEYLSVPDRKPWYYKDLGNFDYWRGDTSKALQDYREAARLFLQTDSNKEKYFTFDAMLRTSQMLYKLGDEHSAGKVLLAYLHRSDYEEKYVPMAHALKTHHFRNYFALMLNDSTSYTNNNPNDLAAGGLQWLYAGAEQGARGDYRGAQRDLRVATQCIWWDSTYAVFAWAGATYALGETVQARNAWIEALGEGDSSPGDMPFNSQANAAAATMLLTL